MPIPASPRAVFRRNVLESVLCQLRFPPILSIGTKDPADFQDKVRANYPLYMRDESARLPVDIRQFLGDMSIGRAELVRHVFRTADQARSIVLTRDFVAIEQTNYERWERFFPEVLLAMSALREAYQAPFFQRVGLRYQNIIDRTKIPALSSSQWNDLIAEPFIGVLREAELLHSVREQKTELVIALDEVPEAYVRLTHGLRTVPSSDTPVYFFDADFFKEGRIDHNDIEALLGSFHVAAGNLFRWSITRDLYNALEPEEL